LAVKRQPKKFRRPSAVISKTPPARATKPVPPPAGVGETLTLSEKQLKEIKEKIEQAMKQIQPSRTCRIRSK